MSLNYNGKRPVVDCFKDKGLTVQADRDEADINKIIARFEKTGSLGRLASREPFYGDVSEFDGLAAAIMKVNEASDMFSQYDAKVRERFDNDPVKFVEFFEDPGNLKEAIDLGLALPRPEASKPIAAPVPEPGQ